jgi:hypothetical protein
MRFPCEPGRGASAQSVWSDVGVAPGADIPWTWTPGPYAPAPVGVAVAGHCSWSCKLAWLYSAAMAHAATIPYQRP